jgi:hypothetical protein
LKYGIYTLAIENYLTKYLSSYNLYSKFLTFGWGNGYILLPPNHPLYEIEYGSIDNIKIHGGLTYGQFFNSESFLKWTENLEIGGDLTRENFEKFNNYWIIGFDTNHYGDNDETWTKEYVISQSEYLMEQCLDDKIEGVKKYKYKYLRKDKLKNINQVIKKNKEYDNMPM